MFQGLGATEYACPCQPCTETYVQELRLWEHLLEKHKDEIGIVENMGTVHELLKHCRKIALDKANA